MIDNLKILIIDDNEDDRLLYRRTLNKNANKQFNTVEASNGDEGLKMAAEEAPDCILLDYSMPGHDGVEILKTIRSRHPFIPVVMLTGQGNEMIAVTAIQEGAQNYISKSLITPDSLQHVVNVAIEHCSMQKRISDQRASLEIFTRALAHDLKEPVRTISSFTALLKAQEKFSEKGQNYFAYISKAVDRMARLIETVYLYTRLEDSETKISKESCDMRIALEDVKENLNELINMRKVAITSDRLPSEIFANRIQMIQLFQNLIGNAITHCEKSPVIHISAEEKGEQWLFSVNDNGPGINKEYAEKIFEPFKRVSQSKEQGLGMGLAICKRIVEIHGGKLWYQPGREGGSSFMFTLNTYDLGADGKKVLKENSGQEGEAKGQEVLANVLLVEDNDADVELARIMLIEEGKLRCNLLVAHDGREALSMLKRATDAKPIDLILLDINMPGMDGFELLEKMHSEKPSKDIPVVMCSTSTYDKDLERAKELGVIGYLNKPADLHKLKPVIGKAPHVVLSSDGQGFNLFRAA